MRLPSLDALRAFDAAARLGTFERAAESLHITASAIGKRIAALEELLGVALFQRGGKALLLSAAGREYLGSVRSALELLAAVPLHQRAAQQRPRLRLCAPPTFARQVLVPALPGFAAEQPGVELEIVLSAPFIDAGGSDAELDVRHAAATADDPAVLMHDVLLPLASPALLAEAGPLAEPADLARLPLLRTPIEPWATWFEAVGLGWPEPDRGPRLVDLGLALEAALQGQGVVLARPSLAREALRSGRLLPVLGLGRTPWVAARWAYQLQSPLPAEGLAASGASWLRRACAQAATEGLALISGPA